MTQSACEVRAARPLLIPRFSSSFRARSVGPLEISIGRPPEEIPGSNPHAFLPGDLTISPPRRRPHRTWTWSPHRGFANAGYLPVAAIHTESAWPSPRREGVPTAITASASPPAPGIPCKGGGPPKFRWTLQTGLVDRHHAAERLHLASLVARSRRGEADKRLRYRPT